MERWGVTSQSCDPVGRFCRHVDRPQGNHTASTRSLRPAPDTSDLSSLTMWKFPVTGKGKVVLKKPSIPLCANDDCGIEIEGIDLLSCNALGQGVRKKKIYMMLYFMNKTLRTPPLPHLLNKAIPEQSESGPVTIPA